MNYEDFREEFIKIIEEERLKKPKHDFVEFMADCAWMAMGRLRAKGNKDAWGRDENNLL